METRSSKITTPLESIGYIDLTVEVMSAFGVTIENVGHQLFRISGGQSYKATDYRVEGIIPKRPSSFALMHWATTCWWTISRWIRCRAIALSSPFWKRWAFLSKAKQWPDRHRDKGAARYADRCVAMPRHHSGRRVDGMSERRQSRKSSMPADCASKNVIVCKQQPDELKKLGADISCRKAC